MGFESDLLLVVVIFAAALLYSLVGFGGGSGYLAAMALYGLGPAVMRSTALTLNIFVTTIGTAKYYRAGAFSWKVFWPVAVASVPSAFVGGLLTLPGWIYEPVVGVVLLFASWRVFHTTPREREVEPRAPSIPVSLLAGAGIGLLSGVTGVGGAIFLAPLLVFKGWAGMRVVSGITAAFVLVNSTAALVGVLSVSSVLHAALPMWAAAAVLGGFLGSELGSRRLSSAAIRRVLAAVLAIAGLKMILWA